MSDLAKCASSGIEYRDVTVIDQIDRARGLCETIRTDTNEIIETRHLTPRELQMSFEELTK